MAPKTGPLVSVVIPVFNAEKWLTRPGIRIASPEEVAKEYGL